MADHRSEQARSTEDLAAYWSEQARRVDWITKPRRALDDRTPHRWFLGATLNTCFNALDRHVVHGHGDRTALVHDDVVTGCRASFTYVELLEGVAAFAGALQGFGIGVGDRVLIQAAMIPETVIAMLACARIGAVHHVVPDGSAPHELAARIDEARPKVVVTASCGVRPSGWVASLPVVHRALEEADHQPEAVIVKQRPQRTVELHQPRDVDWDAAVRAGATDPAGCVEVAADAPLYVLHTADPADEPERIVRDNGSHAVAMAWALPNLYDVHAGQVWWAACDLASASGHSFAVYAPLFCGVTTVLHEGDAPGFPGPAAISRVVAEHRVESLLVTDGTVVVLAEGDRGPDRLRRASERIGVPVHVSRWQTDSDWPFGTGAD